MGILARPIIEGRPGHPHHKKILDGIIDIFKHPMAY